MNLGKLNPINLIHRQSEVKPMPDPTPAEIASVETFLAAHPAVTATPTAPSALNMVETAVPAGTVVSMSAPIPASVPLVQPVHTAVAVPAAVTAVTAAPAPHRSILQVIGADVKAVFAWIGSPRGQAVIATGEAVIEAVYPPATGLIALANITLTEVIKIEALAAGAGAQSGSGTQKATGVVAALTPEILAYAQQNGLATPTADKIKVAVDALVTFANAFEVAPVAA